MAIIPCSIQYILVADLFYNIGLYLLIPYPKSVPLPFPFGNHFCSLSFSIY